MFKAFKGLANPFDSDTILRHLLRASRIARAYSFHSEPASEDHEEGQRPTTYPQQLRSRTSLAKPTALPPASLLNQYSLHGIYQPMPAVTRESLIAEARETKAGALEQRDVKTVIACTELLRRLGDERFTEQEEAEIRLIAELDAMPTALYRHFDHEGRLLYVGISLKAISRTMQHRLGSHWYTNIARIELEWFGSKSAAVDAEKTAVKAEKPLHNITYNKANGNVAEERKARTVRAGTRKRVKRQPSL
jgi:hypothetical protein